MSASINSRWKAFSYESCFHEDGKHNYHNIIKNISNVIAYIPGVSIISGIARMIFASHMLSNANNEKQVSIARSHLIKGVIETLTIFGVILLIIDIYNTVHNTQDVLKENHTLPQEPTNNQTSDPAPITVKSDKNEIKTMYRPTFDKTISKNSEGRVTPFFYHLTYGPSINSKTSVNEFYEWCENNKHYQLDHTYPDSLDHTYPDNAFTIAAEAGNIEILKAIVEIAPQLVDLEGYYGTTALLCACALDDKTIALEMATMLINNGADVNLTNPKSFDSTPLSVATRSDNEEVVKLLLSKGAKLQPHLSVTNQNDIREAKKPEEKIAIISALTNPRLYNVTYPAVWSISKVNQVYIKNESEKVWSVWSKVNFIPKDLIVEIFKTYHSLFPLKFWNDTEPKKILAAIEEADKKSAEILSDAQ